VYRKPTNTNTYWKNSSCHPIEHKKSLIYGLHHRALEICNTKPLLEAEFEHLEKHLLKEGFDVHLIRRTREKAIQNKANKAEEKERKKYIGRMVIPYDGRKSIGLKRKLATYDIETILKPKTKIIDIVTNYRKNLKEKIAGVIYEAKCIPCGETYIGETGREEKIRRREHINAVKREDTKGSAIAEHICNNEHSSVQSFDFRTIDKEDNKFIRKFKESFYIRKRNATLNRRWEKGNLPEIYINTLDFINE
jgi:hypothetical protein